MNAETQPSQADAEPSYRSQWIARVCDEIECDDPFYRRFRAFIGENYPEHSHAIRYCRTFAFMIENGIEFAGKKICDTGQSPMLDFLNQEGCEVVTTSSDLRYSIDREDASVDLFFSLEVIEHLKDQESEKMIDIALFNGSGAKAYVAEIARILKPGGHVMLTTPNPVSMLSLMHLAEGNQPMVFAPHVREYTAEELREMFEGFEETAYRDQFCFGYFAPSHRERVLKETFGETALAFAERGDDHFFLFRKPV
jgi:SAM-dependent methyltransferase